MIAEPATLAAANRRSLAVARDWRDCETLRRLDDAFASVGPGDDEAVAGIAERLLRDKSWVVALLEPLKSAAIEDASARSAMLLALLRSSGRSDAAAAFDRASRDDVFLLRWQAMREWLALDAATASPRLAEMAQDDPHDEIRSAARATLRLMEQRLAERCPA